MQQRASLLGGDTTIKPAVGKGTAVTVTMPFEQPAAKEG
jgi:signal transduction histidine kinase